MGLLDNIFNPPEYRGKSFLSLQGTPVQEMKAAYDLMPVGVQGRPQYPPTDIESLQRAYTRNEIVYAAINAKAQAAVDPRMLVEGRSAKGEWGEIDGHPFRRLMMKPNPDMDEAAFTQAVITSCDIAGAFYAEIVRGSNKLPIELHPLNPAKITPLPRADLKTDYQFKDGSRKVVIPWEDMVVWRRYNPLNRWHGLSPLAVCLGSVDADSAQTDYIRAFFNNAGVPSGLLKVLNRKLTQAEADELSAKIAIKYGRERGNQHRTMVIDENAEYQKMGANLNELQGDTLREFTETRVAMTIGTPPLIIYAYAGLLRATYSNLKEAYKGFWDHKLTPWFKEYRTFLQWRLLTEFVSQDLIFGERIRLNWDMSQVAALQEDVTAIQDRAEKAFRAGGISLNEYRARIGEEPDAAGDYYLRPFSVIPEPVGQAPEAPQATPEPPKAILPPRTLKAVVKAQRAGRVTIERRIEKSMQKLLKEQYRTIAAAVERAA